MAIAPVWLPRVAVRSSLPAAPVAGSAFLRDPERAPYRQRDERRAPNGSGFDTDGIDERAQIRGLADATR